jgi:tRNA pseudouridine38-40 synthase
MRIALGIEYNGRAYCGWQSQPSGCGVQDHVEAALAKFAGTPDARFAITCAGRTDAGVHALGQVVHFDTGLARDNSAWVRGTNACLPADIRVLWAVQVPEEFHARFAAQGRIYRYLLLNDPVAPALLVGMVGWIHAPLAVSPMQEAASMLLGEHDFSAFRAAECQAKSPVKTIRQADIRRRGGLIEFNFAADAFLHHMVRNIVGGLVYVGAGRHTVGEFAAILQGRDRTRAAPTFSPDGLYLWQIEYDGRFAIPPSRDRHPACA